MSFADAVAMAPTDAGWHGKIQPGWDIGGNANGGYLIALAASAMAQHAGRPDVATITAHYLRPAPPGPVTVAADLVKAGRRFTTVRATLDSGLPLLALLGSFTDHRERHDERTVSFEDEPDFPPPDRCLRIDPTDTFPPPIMGRVDLRLHPEDNFYDGPTGRPTIRGWVKLADDEPWTTGGLLLAADVFPPTVFNADVGLAWVPTIELTVHVRSRPSPGWLKCAFVSRFVTGGFVEEDGLIWDSRGSLVAQSRQLALLPRT